MAVFSVNAALLDALVLSVAAKGDTYGYELTQTIQRILPISETALYPVLRRLQKNECLEMYDQSYQGRNRRYYRITPQGQACFAAYCKEWKQYKKQIDFFLEEDVQ